MKKIIGYILMASPLLVLIGLLFLADWKFMLMVIGGMTIFTCCFIIGAKLIE
jgi:ABC-type bacteriocin/lantibiotic exporter with double-glycine peptidase domain